MWKKLFSIRILKRIYLERLGEPLLYNLVSLFVLLFGKFETKIDYDLVPRQPYAFGLKTAFLLAVESKVEKILILEFGVASGAGLFNLAIIAKKLSQIYSIDYEVIGFDTGKGMPPPIDYRDHPEKYRFGDFPPMTLTESKLPDKTKIYYGAIDETITLIRNDLKENARIGFVSIDVDYYSSTKDVLGIFELDESNYLPRSVVYLDDVNNVDHNDYCGELLAVKEFNSKDSLRKVCKMTQLRNWRIFKNALWLDQMYFLHVLDSQYRFPSNWENLPKTYLYNPYL